MGKKTVARLARLLVVGLCLVRASWAWAAEVAADLPSQPIGARSFSMGGAHRGLGNGNEALWLNPAGMALTQRYSIDLLYGYEAAAHHQLNASVVDSKSGPVAGGIAYTRDWIGQNTSGSLNRTSLGFAYRLGEALALGVTGHNLVGKVKSSGDITSWNLTAGVAALLGELVGVGVSYQNLIASSVAAPSILGFGAALRSQALSVAFDVDVATQTARARPWTYRAGAELFVMEAVALRGGWRHGPPEPLSAAPTVHAITAGAGILGGGGGFNVAFERVVSEAPRWALVGTLQVFL